MDHLVLHQDARWVRPAAEAAPVDPGPEYDAAYKRRLPEIMALAPADLVPVNIDVRGAIATVLGALPKLDALRPQVATLDHFNLALFDALEDYANATGRAHSLYLGAMPQGRDLVALYDAAVKVRDTLRGDVHPLIQHGLLDGQRFAAFKGLSGYKNVAFDLIGMADVLLACWQPIAGKTAVTQPALIQTKRLAEQLLARSSVTRTVGEAAVVRQRAFTLLSRAYNQARRAVAFLRWDQGDAESIAPSLYAGRGRRTITAGQEPVPPGSR